MGSNNGDGIGAGSYEASLNRVGFGCGDGNRQGNGALPSRQTGYGTAGTRNGDGAEDLSDRGCGDFY